MMNYNNNKINCINFLQWNCEGLNSRKLELKKLLYEFKIKFCCLQETFLRKNKAFSLNDYYIIRKDRNDLSNYNPRGGVALLIHSSIKYKTININNPNNESAAVAIVTKLNNRDICVISIYCNPRHKISAFEWKNFYQQINYPVIIFGDFNASHSLWSIDNHQDFEGSALEEFINEFNLVLLNNDSMTRVPRFNWRNSIIDLTIMSPELCLNVENWNVINEAVGSTHYPILLSYNNFVNNELNNSVQIKRRNFKKANWPLYKQLILENTNNLNINARNNLEEKYEKFIDITNKSAKESIPESVINKFDKKRGQIPWWDTSCNHEIAKRKLALTKFNRSGSYHDYLNFKKTCAKTKKYLKNRQRLEWHNYCEKLSPANSIQEVWNMVRRISGNPIVGRSYDDNWIPQFLANYCGTIPSQNLILNCESTIDIEDEILDSNITLVELKSALAHNKNTSTGMDRINYRMIQELPDNALNFLVGIMNESFSSSYIPLSWKNHVVIPVLKKDKDPNDHSSYRPITLLSCVGKTLESIFKRRIEWFIEHFDKFPKSQFGFRKGKGVHDNLNILNTDIRISFSKNEYLLAVFLDVQGAYDNIDFCILADAMKKIGITNKMINWIIKYFQERYIYVRYDNKYFGPKIAYKGIPQGSILGPILYSIYTASIESYVKNDDIEILQFADDIVVYTSSRCLEVAAEKIQNSLYKIEEVFNNLKMVPSTQKTQFIAFTRHRINSPLQLSFFNDEIHIINSAKYLGVYFVKI